MASSSSFFPIHYARKGDTTDLRFPVVSDVSSVANCSGLKSGVRSKIYSSTHTANKRMREPHHLAIVNIITSFVCHRGQVTGQVSKPSSETLISQPLLFTSCFGQDNRGTRRLWSMVPVWLPGLRNYRPCDRSSAIESHRNAVTPTSPSPIFLWVDLCGSL